MQSFRVSWMKMVVNNNIQYLPKLRHELVMTNDNSIWAGKKYPSPLPLLFYKTQ